METDYREIKVHPLFEPIKKLFVFVIYGSGFLMMPKFQKSFLAKNPGAQSIFDDYNKETNLTVSDTEISINAKTYLTPTGRLMAIAIFDFLQCSEFQSYLSQTEIYKFARHIRNGSAHNNKFFFDKKSMKELSTSPVKWGDKTIDISLMGKTVVPDFIGSYSLLCLMGDISKMIEEKQTTK
ncbi:MAG TPA: hypothetical protein VLH94_00340 [Spirochaetia bacterium]|nr:hypothetical protein [Spirochaetia bacterium]